MLNLSDKDIDRLSRDAAEFYEPDDSMLSWNRLVQNLSRQIPERPPDTPSVFRIRPLVWGPTVLLLAGITYFIIKNAGYSKHSTLKNQSENVAGVSADHSGQGAAGAQDKAKALIPGHANVSPEGASKSSASGEKILPGKEARPDASNEIAASVNNSKTNRAKAVPGNSRVADASVSEKEKIPSENSSGKRNSGTPVITLHDPNVSGGPSGENASSRLHAGTGNGNHRQSAKTHLQNNLSENIPAEPAAEISEQNVVEKAARTRQVNLPSLVIHTDPLTVNGNDSLLNRFAALNAAPKPALTKSLRINHSFVVGVVTGPDYTNAGGMTNDQLSNNLGISMGYYLSSRLSVNTGFSYTTKFYWTDGKSFQPGPQSNSSISSYAAFPRIESVNGSSDIYEIPLTLRYDFVRIEKTRLFVSAGLSSYLIRKQEYTYFFHNAGRAYEWENMNNSHPDYWFSVGNFSGGFEHEIGKGFTFQLESFVRTPFRGMGAGNMKLNSYGMLFSIRYSPVLGRSRK